MYVQLFQCVDFERCCSVRNVHQAHVCRAYCENGNVIRTVSVDLPYHVFQLLVAWVLSQRSHHRPQFLGGDIPVTVLVEQRECLLQL